MKFDFSKKPATTDTSASSGAGVIVSPTKGDGRGNDLHSEKTGRFVAKGSAGEVAEQEATEQSVKQNNIAKYFTRLSKVYEAPTMRNFMIHRQKRLAKRMAGLSDQQKQNQEILRPYVKNILDSSNFTIGITLRNLMSVLKDGEYKNQFATGTSHGLLSRDRRFRVSESFFGHGLSSMELGTKLEKNGFMQSKKIKNYFEEKSGSVYGGYSASQYQDSCKISIILKKKELADRTTYCFGDSLNQESSSRGGILPQKYTLPWDIGTMPGYMDRILNDAESTKGMLEKDVGLPCKAGEDFSGDGSFIECQYHGPLTCDLMSKVVIGNRNYFNSLGEDDRKKLLTLLNQRGMRALINKGDNVSLEEVKLDESGNIYYTTYESEEIDDD